MSSSHPRPCKYVIFCDKGELGDQMELRLSISWSENREIILGYLDRASVTTRVLKMGRREAEEPGQSNLMAEGLAPLPLSLKMTEESHRKGRRAVINTEKQKELDSSQEPPERNMALLTPPFWPRESHFRHLNSRNIILPWGKGTRLYNRVWASANTRAAREGSVTLEEGALFLSSVKSNSQRIQRSSQKLWEWVPWSWRETLHSTPQYPLQAPPASLSSTCNAAPQIQASPSFQLLQTFTRHHCLVMPSLTTWLKTSSPLHSKCSLSPSRSIFPTVLIEYTLIFYYFYIYNLLPYTRVQSLRARTLVRIIHCFMPSPQNSTGL